MRLIVGGNSTWGVYSYAQKRSTQKQPGLAFQNSGLQHANMLKPEFLNFFYIFKILSKKEQSWA
jgi:hypothetical protein